MLEEQFPKSVYDKTVSQICVGIAHSGCLLNYKTFLRDPLMQEHIKRHKNDLLLLIGDALVTHSYHQHVKALRSSSTD